MAAAQSLHARTLHYEDKHTCWIKEGREGKWRDGRGRGEERERGKRVEKERVEKKKEKEERR